MQLPASTLSTGAQLICRARRLSAPTLRAATLHARTVKTTTEALQLVLPVFQYLCQRCRVGEAG
jgi:hypothetical protein